MRPQFALRLAHTMLAITLGLAATVCGAGETFDAKAVGVADGDTVTVLRNGHDQVRIRLSGIDAPELHQAFGQQAKGLMSRLVFGRNVSVSVVDHDRYRRTVARLSVDGQDVGPAMLRQGLAWHYKHYDSDPVYAGAENAARAQLLGLDDAPDVQPRYNISPTQPVGIVRVHARTSGREWANVRWGLIPHWSKQPRESPPLFNARAETVATKPAFRDAFRKRRCLIPADGFYEWKAAGNGTKKRPYLVSMTNARPFAFAGLWDRWERVPDPPIESCTIITTEPNDVVRELHNRMPVILAADDYARWLDPAQPRDALQALLVPFVGELAAVPVPPLPRPD